jgi:HK97 family phage major capsid protein
MIDLKKYFDIENMDEVSVKTIEAIEKSLNEGFENMKKGLSHEESFAKVNDAIDELKSMNATKEMTERIEAIEKKMIELNAQKTGEKTMSKTAKFEEAFKSHMTIDGKGYKYVDFKSALRGGQVKIELDKKDATTIMGNGATTRVEVDKNISTPIYQPWLFAVANVTRTTSPTVIYVDKSAPEGTPAFVVEGGAKPLISWEYEPKTVNVKKVAAVSKFTTEVATDIEGFVTELTRDLASQIRAKSENDILSGDGAGGGIVGVESNMPGYTLNTIKVANPNTFDAIIAAATQVKSSAMGAFTPTHAVLNPQDVANMKLAKNTNGDYVMPWEFEGNPLELKVVESANRPVGSLIVGDFKYLNIKEYVDMELIFGHENDDIRKNLMTVVAETRFAPYIKTAEKYAFVSDTIANITTAIKKA